jgi:hypothetical protein
VKANPLVLSEWLSKREDLDPELAYQWASFVVSAFELLGKAQERLLTRDAWNTFIQNCVASLPTEPEITSGLGDAMEEIIDVELGLSPWEGLQPQYERCIPGSLHGNRKKRADFRFRRALLGQRIVQFYIEAKSLRRLCHVKGRLLSLSGIGCFLKTSPPYGDHPVAGMVGYVIMGQPQTYHAELLASVASDTTQNAIRVDEISLLPQINCRAAASDHTRTNAYSPVTLVHAFLDFTARTQASQPLGAQPS